MHSQTIRGGGSEETHTYMVTYKGCQKKKGVGYRILQTETSQQGIYGRENSPFSLGMRGALAVFLPSQNSVCSLPSRAAVWAPFEQVPQGALLRVLIQSTFPEYRCPCHHPSLPL